MMLQVVIPDVSAIRFPLRSGSSGFWGLRFLVYGFGFRILRQEFPSHAPEAQGNACALAGPPEAATPEAVPLGSVWRASAWD